MDTTVVSEHTSGFAKQLSYLAVGKVVQQAVYQNEVKTFLVRFVSQRSQRRSSGGHGNWSRGHGFIALTHMPWLMGVGLLLACRDGLRFQIACRNAEMRSSSNGSGCIHCLS